MKKKTTTTKKTTKKTATKTARTAKTATEKRAGGGADVLWDVVARVGKKSKGDLEKAISAFEKELAALDDKTLLRVEAAFADAMHRADNWDLWGAAFLIHGVISDDMFWDVRAGLVALGRERFEAAIRDPDSLAAVKDVVRLTLFEGFQYVPSTALEDRDLESTYVRARGKAGKGENKWDIAALEAGDNAALVKRFPRLAKRFDE